MSNVDLDRVRADLAIIRGVCTEPAIPAEEFGVGLIVGTLGVAMIIATWMVPATWVAWGCTAFAVVGTAIYIPWKRRIIEKDARRRQLETNEIRIWTVAVVGILAYLLWRRFALPPGRGYGEACFFAVGLGLVANAMVHPTRRPYLAQGIPVMIAALLLSFSHRAEINLTIIGACLVSGGFGFSAALARLARRERSEHDGH